MNSGSNLKGVPVMRKLTGSVICFGCAFLWTGPACAQFGRGSGDWTTSGNDAQRSSWVRTDAKISPQSIRKSGFHFLWKVKLSKDQKASTPVTPPVLLNFYIGYRGFRSLGFLGGASDNVYAVDTDLARIEWHKRLSSALSRQSGSSNCAETLVSDVTRPTMAEIAPAPVAAAGGFGGRGGPARSGVGKPGEGAVTLAQAPMVRPAPPPPKPRAGPGRRAPAPAFSPFEPRPTFAYALSRDGMLHAMYVSNGEEPAPPVRFLPPDANAHGLIVVGNAVYAATSQGCGSAPDAVWALDLATKQVATWKSNSGGVVGSAGPAMDPDGTLYVATRGGTLTALEPTTLQAKDWYTSGQQEFTSSPVLFQYKESLLLAATTRDGRVHLLDTKSLGGADHQTPLHKTPVYSDARDFAPGALASWQDAAGARWVLAPTAGPVASGAGFAPTNGNVTNGAIVAWKVVDQNGAPSLQPGWVSRNIVAPLPPMVVNGVIFAASGGAQRSSRSILYALDAATGKELWSSGNTITSLAHNRGLSAGSGQLYLGTHDGTLYAFGFPMEH
jgi:outer membrane protein assembly factor BamB